MKKFFSIVVSIVLFAIGTPIMAQEYCADYNAVSSQPGFYTYHIIVLDNQGVPVVGASVVVKGTTIGTVSDMDGNAYIPGNTGTVIVISYIGYQTQEIKLSSNRQLLVVLQEDTEPLDSLE